MIPDPFGPLAGRRKPGSGALICEFESVYKHFLLVVGKFFELDNEGATIVAVRRKSLCRNSLRLQTAQIMPKVRVCLDSQTTHVGGVDFWKRYHPPFNVAARDGRYLQTRPFRAVWAWASTDGWMNRNLEPRSGIEGPTDRRVLKCVLRRELASSLVPLR